MTARLTRFARPLLVVAMVVATVVVLAAGPASACDCAVVTPEQAITNADAVFLGTVAGHVDGPGNTTKWRFTVTRVFKGVVHQHQTVVSNTGQGACGLALPSNSALLMVGRFNDAILDGAHLGAGELAASACVGVIRPEGLAVPIAFGPGSPPLPGSSSTTHDFANADRIGLVAGFAALAGIVLWRRSKGHKDIRS
jgi:hypothetical protein